MKIMIKAAKQKNTSVTVIIPIIELAKFGDCMINEYEIIGRKIKSPQV